MSALRSPLSQMRRRNFGVFLLNFEISPPFFPFSSIQQFVPEWETREDRAGRRKNIPEWTEREQQDDNWEEEKKNKFHDDADDDEGDQWWRTTIFSLKISFANGGHHHALFVPPLVTKSPANDKNRNRVDPTFNQLEAQGQIKLFWMFHQRKSFIYGLKLKKLYNFIWPML